MNKNYPDISENNVSEEYYIVFSLRDKSYAINIENVVEVINIPDIEMPEAMPNGVTGIFNYKGLIIKALDLSSILGFEQKKYNKTSKLIIINAGGAFLAIHVDSIVNISLFKHSLIQPIPYSVEKPILTTIYQNEIEPIGIIDVNQLEEAFSFNPQKYDLVNYDDSFSIDKKSKQILDLKSGTSVKNNEEYAFAFNPLNHNQYILFTINNSNFFINLKYVKEFESLRMHKITKLPYTPNYISGIINVKGEFIVVIDLKIFLNIGDQNSDTQTPKKLIIIDRKDYSLALLVDDIKYIRNLGDLKPKQNNDVTSKYIYTEFYKNNKLYTVLNTEKIITDERIYINIE